MNNYNIEWKKLTEIEAQQILDGICGSFNVLAKTRHQEGLQDVCYLELRGVYDDNFHDEKN